MKTHKLFKVAAKFDKMIKVANVFQKADKVMSSMPELLKNDRRQILIDLDSTRQQLEQLRYTYNSQKALYEFFDTVEITVRSIQASLEDAKKEGSIEALKRFYYILLAKKKQLKDEVARELHTIREKNPKVGLSLVTLTSVSRLQQLADSILADLENIPSVQRHDDELLDPNDPALKEQQSKGVVPSSRSVFDVIPKSAPVKHHEPSPLAPSFEHWQESSDKTMVDFSPKVPYAKNVVTPANPIVPLPTSGIDKDRIELTKTVNVTPGAKPTNPIAVPPHKKKEEPKKNPPRDGTLPSAGNK